MQNAFYAHKAVQIKGEKNDNRTNIWNFKNR